MATRFIYPIDLTEEDDGSLSVRFPDLPEAMTSGSDRAEALEQAADCLEEALANRIALNMDIPKPSPAKGRPTVLGAPALISRL